MIAVVTAGQQEPQQVELTPDDRAFVRRSAFGALVLLGVLIGAPVAIAAAVLSIVGIAKGELVMILAGPLVVLAGVIFCLIVVLSRRAQLRRDMAAGIKLVWDGPVRLESKFRGRARVCYVHAGSQRVEVPAFIHGRMDPNGVYHIEFLPSARMALRIHDRRTGEAVFPPRRSES